MVLPNTKRATLVSVKHTLNPFEEHHGELMMLTVPFAT